MTIERAVTDNEQGDSLDDAVLRSMVGYNLKRAYIVMHPMVHAALAAHDLRVVSFSCLSMIITNPGIAPSRLAEMLRMERSNLVVVIDELESRELITRKQMKTDRRRYELTATMRGRRLRDKAAREIVSGEQKLLAPLSAEERTQLVSLLNKIESAASS